MLITPEEIDEKRFKTTRLKEGYDQDDVDTFLDRVQVDYAFLRQTVARLEEDNRVLRRGSEAPTSVMNAVKPEAPSAVAEKRLEVATEAAQRIEDDAQGRASKMLADAQAEADDIIREAGAKAAKLIEDAAKAEGEMKSRAQAQASAIVSEARTREGEMRNRVDDLSRQVTSLEGEKAAYKRWLKGLLSKMEDETRE